MLQRLGSAGVCARIREELQLTRLPVVELTAGALVVERFDRPRDAIDNLDLPQGMQLLGEARFKETPVLPPMRSQSHP